MTEYNRVGKRWTVNEVLALQREFELLGLSIDQIAEKHQRTPNGIMYKLDHEGFADYNDLYSAYYLNESTENGQQVSLDGYLSDDELTDGEDDLSKRVYSLESGLNEIKHMLKMLTSSVHGLSQTIYGSNGVPHGVDH
jgi:hypothetical protein